MAMTTEQLKPRHLTRTLWSMSAMCLGQAQSEGEDTTGTNLLPHKMAALMLLFRESLQGMLF